MNKYVNIEELKKVVNEEFCLDFTKIVLNNTINEMSTADIVEVKHGHWELDGTCSVCGKHTLQTYGNFCCYCGADMREVGESE